MWIPILFFWSILQNLILKSWVSIPNRISVIHVISSWHIKFERFENSPSITFTVSTMTSTPATASSMTHAGNISLFIFADLLTCMIDHFIPPSCDSELPCSRKPEPDAHFACNHCLHKIHDGPPNSTWDIPKSDSPLREDTLLLSLPGKSLFSFYLRRLKIFFCPLLDKTL